MFVELHCPVASVIPETEPTTDTEAPASGPATRPWLSHWITCTASPVTGVPVTETLAVLPAKLVFCGVEVKSKTVLVIVPEPIILVVSVRFAVVPPARKGTNQSPEL